MKGETVRIAVRSAGRAGRSARRAVVALLSVALVTTTVSSPARAGDEPAAPAAAVPSPLEAQIHSRLQNLLTPALSAAADTQVRALVRNAVGRQFDIVRQKRGELVGQIDVFVHAGHGGEQHHQHAERAEQHGQKREQRRGGRCMAISRPAHAA